MLVKDFLETEKHLNTLDNEVKQKLIANINFMLVSHINKQNNLELFSVIQKLSNLLTEENQKQVLSNVNNVILNFLSIQGIDIFTVIPKLFGILNEENKNKLFSDINLLLEHSSTSSKDKIITPIPAQTEQIKYLNPLTKPVNNKIGLLRPPPPVPRMSAPVFKEKMNNLLSQLPVSALQNQHISKSATLSTTGTFSLKSKTDKPAQDTLSVDEVIKYLIPYQTEIAEKALTNFSTPNEVYQFLKQVNGKNSLEDIHNNIYDKTDIISLIYKTHSIFTSRYITLCKANNTPSDKSMQIKIGEWMIYLGFIDKDKLERIVALHNLAVRTELRKGNRSVINGQVIESKGPLFGAFLLESEIITKQQLEQALMIQTKYNELINNIK